MLWRESPGLGGGVDGGGLREARHADGAVVRRSGARGRPSPLTRNRVSGVHTGGTGTTAVVANGTIDNRLICCQYARGAPDRGGRRRERGSGRGGRVEGAPRAGCDRLRCRQVAVDERAEAEAAKQAVFRSLKALGPRDRFSIVFFDSRAQIVFEDRAKAERAEVEDFARNVNGSMDLGSSGSSPKGGIKKATSILQASKAKRKFVIVFSDGETYGDGAADAVRELSETGAVVSVIGTAVTEPDARSLLAALRDNGKGRLHLVDELGVLPTVTEREVRRMLAPVSARTRK